MTERQWLRVEIFYQSRGRVKQCKNGYADLRMSRFRISFLSCLLLLPTWPRRFRVCRHSVTGLATGFRLNLAGAITQRLGLYVITTVSTLPARISTFGQGHRDGWQQSGTAKAWGATSASTTSIRTIRFTAIWRWPLCIRVRRLALGRRWGLRAERAAQRVCICTTVSSKIMYP